MCLPAFLWSLFYRCLLATAVVLGLVVAFLCDKHSLYRKKRLVKGKSHVIFGVTTVENRARYVK
jgi:hypothetical protein